MHEAALSLKITASERALRADSYSNVRFRLGEPNDNVAQLSEL